VTTYTLDEWKSVVKRSFLAAFSVVAAIFAAQSVSASDELLRVDVIQKRLTVSTGKSTIVRYRSVHQQLETLRHFDGAANATGFRHA
jgi:hypothetical protein